MFWAEAREPPWQQDPQWQQEPQDSKVELTRAAMEKYVTLRGAIGKEKARLAEDKEFLADQIAILTEQVAMERAAVDALQGGQRALLMALFDS